MQEASCRRHLEGASGGGIIGGDIWRYLEGIWEVSGGSGKHLGTIWEASGRHLERPGKLLEAVLGLLGSRGVLEQKCAKTIMFYRRKLRDRVF